MSSILHKKASINHLNGNNTTNAIDNLKKQTSSGNFNTKGTVMSLNPSSPITCKESTTIFEASQKMVASKGNHMLVIDDNEELLGIFTTKDLAFRVVGTKLNVKNTKVTKIMTPNPMCAKIITKASDALNLMVIKHFRHLPIANKDNQIVGVLDITKCYNEAMKKLEKLYKDSKKLYDAMETVNKELINSKSQHNYIITYFENLKKILSGPTLNQLLNDESTLPVYCSIESSVYDATMLMKLKNTTAILVRDLNEEIIGIFTSKDVVSRVISRGINPNECKVGNVMTINPATAPTTLSINKALKQMFDGKYLNLPVINKDTNEIVGIVDVIRLTNFTLNQIQTMESFNEEEEGDNDDDDDIFDSITNELDNNNGNNNNNNDFNKFLHTIQNDDELYDSSMSSVGDVSVDEMAQFDLSTMSYDNNTLNNKVNNNIPKKMNSVLSLGVVDFNEVCFFKFKVSRGRIHRISYRPSDGILKFKELLKDEFSKEELENFDQGNFEISYIDEDNDIIVINTDKDLEDCVLLMKSLQKDKIEIMLYDKHEILLGKKGKMSTLNLRSSYNKKNEEARKDYLLPVAMFTLAATIIVVFTLSRKK